MQTSFPNLCLVYIASNRSFSDVNGITHIGRIDHSFEQNNHLWHEVELLTDEDGEPIYQPQMITVLDSTIVSKRPIHDISPHRFYQISTAIDGINFDRPKATGFVIKSQSTAALTSTSRSGFGSGLYGLFISNPEDIQYFITDPNQKIYNIDCLHPYIIQDAEHGDSITTASIHTNTYLDRLIESIRSAIQSELSNPDILLQLNPIDNLVNLWNIVFLRTDSSITKSELESQLSGYISKYGQDNSIVDTITGNPLQELFINYLLTNLGYDGLLAKDSYNNRWNRGCVCYSTSTPVIIQGSIAPY